MKYDTKLVDRKEMTGDVMIFRLEKPAGYKFLAGQFCFINVPATGFQDERGLRGHLSIASSPSEKDLLFVTKKSGSAFKQTLAAMSHGAMVSIEDPLGRFTLPEDKTMPIVVLTGGVGIAPFRSWLRFAADARTGHRITLFYSSRKPDETPFLEEMQQIPSRDNEIRSVVTMTRVEDPKTWQGPTGRLTGETVKRECSYWESAVYFIAGPPGMVDVMQQTLDSMNIPKDRVRVELFSGY